MPLAKGDAKVDSKQGSIVVTASFKKMQPAQTFGKEYLTYVLWAITPEGKPNNLGELLLDGDKSKLTATTTLQSFGMIVTAEPYFAVSMPSDVVVMENVVRADTVGSLRASDGELRTAAARANIPTTCRRRANRSRIFLRTCRWRCTKRATQSASRKARGRIRWRRMLIRRRLAR